ncbi:hypothetical protein [Gracilimonas mengyeensis]|uniref:MetA-pathway of phenol degradation n=1 Tax=Gracilimonas mengyeensis TaxID=1302730 RepID=A0A521EIK9_9BACT|nr:hypothetical protein [Gracilimonas mengyeensis]SMO83767.1 hypothetical protein SAMN06265219_11273 [Gracilimonas mengyeensis]
MRYLTKTFIALTALFLSFSASAQAQSFADGVSIDAGLKNMHLWKGYKVSENAVATLNTSYTTESGFFTAGLWYGSSFDASFTEFDYYVAFNLTDDLNLSIWDINNFSDFPNANIFDYDKETTSHFVDATLAYQATDRLGLKWSTIILGRDTYVDDGEVKNAFSNYAEVNVGVVQEEAFSLNAFVGGGFSFLNEEHFYGSSPNIVNVGISAIRPVELFGSAVPVSATAMWNPEQKYGAMQLSVGLF